MCDKAMCELAKKIKNEKDPEAYLKLVNELHQRLTKIEKWIELQEVYYENRITKIEKWIELREAYYENRREILPW